MPRRAHSEMTVDELNYYIQGLFTSDLLLKALVVSGEIAEFKRHTSGHCYFTLLGAETRVSCALFKSDADLLPRWPRDGDMDWRRFVRPVRCRQLERQRRARHQHRRHRVRNADAHAQHRQRQGTPLRVPLLR